MTSASSPPLIDTDPASRLGSDDIVQSDQADVFSLARPLLANPHLPITWAHELRSFR